MKTLKNIVGKFGRPLALAVVGLVLSAASAPAVNIEMWVYARGRYALVVPGFGSGGRVVWSPAHNAYVTDRVARLETVDIYCWPTASGEYAVSRGYGTTCGTTRLGSVPLPNVMTWTIPGNAACDNPLAWVQTNVEFKEKRLPLGSRP